MIKDKSNRDCKEKYSKCNWQLNKRKGNDHQKLRKLNKWRKSKRKAKNQTKFRFIWQSTLQVLWSLSKKQLLNLWHCRLWRWTISNTSINSNWAECKNMKKKWQFEI